MDGGWCTYEMSICANEFFMGLILIRNWRIDQPNQNNHFQLIFKKSCQKRRICVLFLEKMMEKDVRQIERFSLSTWGV